MKTVHFLGTTALAASLVLTPAAFAQAGTAAVAASGGKPGQAGGLPSDPVVGDTADTITVTGSRIAGATALQSSVPVTVVTADELINDGNLSLGDQLNELPSLRQTFSQQNSTRNIGTAGLNLLDLRGLGTDRTLVLVNGRRHVTTVPGFYNIDINTISSALLESVEIVTGGTSAVYGSDAIAGVANFILKRDYEGLEAKLQGGISSRGDRGSYLASIVGGKNFAEGRGNIAASVEYSKQNTLLAIDRNSQTGAYTGVPGFQVVDITSQLINGVLVNEPTGGDGISDTRYFSAYPGARAGNIALGGLVNTSCPNVVGTPTAALLARRAAVCTGQLSPTVANAEFSDPYVFDTNGNLLRDNPVLDLRNVGGGRIGGRTATGVEGAMLQPGIDRINTNMLFSYEFSPALHFHAEGKYVRTTNNQTATQPTTIDGSILNATFSLANPFLTPQAVSTLQTILPAGATSFAMVRFNNDIGTRSEDHKRQTYRIVAGFDGRLSDTGNLSYDVAFNYGRTTTYYQTGGNVDVRKFNAASNAVRTPTGQIVCAVNADASTANDMPGCVPINLFGEYRASQEAIDYVTYVSSRNQWAEEVNAVASLSGDSGGLFSLPGGNVGFVLGVEYRREDAFSDYDDYTQSTVPASALSPSGATTFLNAIPEFSPPAVSIHEGFGEIRVPIVKDSFIKELTLTGAARYSKYSTADDGVWAYNANAVFAPVQDIRFRIGYAKSVRAPSLNNLFAAKSQTFAPAAFVDPCNQGAPIQGNPNRARNCAAAGVPTTLTYTDDQGIVRTIPWVNTSPSAISGVNFGNPGLTPETGKSLTVGAVLTPRFLPGFSLTVDYYRINVSNVIATISPQEFVNRCYDDPVGINNEFCALVARRTSTDPIVNATFAGQGTRRLTGITVDRQLGALNPSFQNRPFNFAALKTAGIDADIRYDHRFGNGVRFGYRAIVSWLQRREEFTFIAAPQQSNRLHGMLGDPVWRGRMSVNLAYRGFDIGYDVDYIGKQAIANSWETQHTHQGRGPTNLDAFPISSYAPQDYHSVRMGYRVNDQFRAYIGVDNIADTLPPYGQLGTGANGGIWNVEGRFLYAGVNVKL